MYRLALSSYKYFSHKALYTSIISTRIQTTPDAQDSTRTMCEGWRVQRSCTPDERGSIYRLNVSCYTRIYRLSVPLDEYLSANFSCYTSVYQLSCSMPPILASRFPRSLQSCSRRERWQPASGFERSHPEIPVKIRSESDQNREGTFPRRNRFVVFSSRYHAVIIPLALALFPHRNRFIGLSKQRYHAVIILLG